MNEEIKPQSEKIEVDRAQLATLIAQNKEMKSLINSATVLMVSITDLFGGQIPTDAMGFIRAAPKIIRAVKDNEDLAKNLGVHIEILKTHAPKYMDAKMSAKIETSIKSLPDGK